MALGDSDGLLTSRSNSKMNYKVGARLLCRASWDNLYHNAEIVGWRDTNPGEEYYVHYIDQNKRLDEWAHPSRLQECEATPSSKSALIESLTPLIVPSAPATATQIVGESFLDTPGASERKLTRNFKRRYDEIHNVQKGTEELPPIDKTLEKEHEEKTKVKNIQIVEMGPYEIDTWYYSPYPEEYSQVHKLFICEFCLKYMKKKRSLVRHKEKCQARYPPGNEIYRTVSNLQGSIRSEQPQLEDPSFNGQAGSDIATKGTVLSVFEVDGEKNKLYCQNLCLLAKLFLDHKTLYYDVDAFLFYILTEVDNCGHHIVGYFSKEKNSVEDYNMACILTLPPFQRKGYGRFLIALAYELSKKEGKVGTPERPLSDLGHVSFKSYWSRALLEALRDHGANLSIKDLSLMTGIRNDDIINTLQSLNLIKYYKGQHIISVSAKVIEEHIKTFSPQPFWVIDAAKLSWTPLASPSTRRPK
ncbi:hypothetical protein L7F22_049225 [Adiantum nelumboides]|nr:hypothetical protein [Adiantum nelumboides]